MNPHRDELLRLAESVAGRMTSRTAPFDGNSFKQWSRSLKLSPAVNAVAKRLFERVLNGVGDGTKRALQIFATTAAEVGDKQTASAMPSLAGRLAERVEEGGRPLEDEDELGAAAQSASGGHWDIASGMVGAIEGAGPDGGIRVDIKADLMGVMSESGEPAVVEGVTRDVYVVWIGGETERERTDRYEWARSTLHATRFAISSGVVSGGGVELVRLADSLRLLRQSDSANGLAARAFTVGLEAPLRAWAKKADQDADEVFESIRDSRLRTFDAFDAGLHTSGTSPPWDAVQVTQEVIGRSANAVAELLGG